MWFRVPVSHLELGFFCHLKFPEDIWNEQIQLKRTSRQFRWDRERLGRTHPRGNQISMFKHWVMSNSAHTFPNPHRLMGLIFRQITCQTKSHVSICGNLGLFYRQQRPHRYFMMQNCKCTDSFGIFLLVWWLGRHRTRNFRALSVLVSPGLKNTLILGGDHIKQAENPKQHPSLLNCTSTWKSCV